jgi:hypothetical protein
VPLPDPDEPLRAAPGRPDPFAALPPEPERTRPDPPSITAGTVFFLLGGAYLLAAGGHLRVNAGWALSVLAVGLGVAGIIGAVLRLTRR